MNRFGNGCYPPREMVPYTAPRTLTRDELEEQTRAFLAQGGRVDVVAIRPADRCETTPRVNGSTVRRYAEPVGLAGRKAKARRERRERVSKAFGGRILMPGSGLGPHPDDAGVARE